MKRNSRFIIVALILIFISSISFAYWYYQVHLVRLNNNNSILAEIKYWGEFAVGTNPTNPPMEFIDDAGQPAGFDIDLANEIADQMGVAAGIEVYSQSGSNESVFADLRSKKVDMVVSSIEQDTQLSQEFIISTNYKASSDDRNYVIVFRKEDAEFRDAVNFALAALQQSGKLDELREKWFARKQ